MILKQKQAVEIQGHLSKPGEAEIRYLATGIVVHAKWNAATVQLQVGTEGATEQYDSHAKFAEAYGLKQP